MNTTEEIPRFSYVSCAALTDVGRKRKNNEDNYGTFPDVGVFCVADGMGGARDGEVASRIVVEHLTGALRNWEKISPPIPIEDRLSLVDKCLDAASLWINQYAASHDATGCGTTFVGVVLDPGKPGHAVAVHAGDSRLYRIHRHKITQITRDHSVANMTGVKDENELNPVFRNMILRAVGIKTSVELERTSFEVASGDWILICSDGLTKMVDDKSIAKILAAAEGGKAAVHMLVDEANRCGGRDNITVVVLHVGELPPALPVHARLTEAEFLTCMGVAASETPATTETTFTMPTGASSTEQNALNASKEDGAANAGWLSEDEDSDNTPVPAAVSRDGGENGGEGGGKEEESPTSARDAPVASAPVEGPDDTKTTEDLLPPTDSDMKTTEDIPPASDRTTDDMPPTLKGRHWHRAVFPVLIGVAVLAGIVGGGMSLLQNAREKARLAEIARAKEAEDARLAANTDFIAKADDVRATLTNLLERIAKSNPPESLTNDLVVAKAVFKAAADKAVGKGVTNAVVSKREIIEKLSNQVLAGIKEKRRELDEAERLLAIEQATKKFELDVAVALKLLGKPIENEAAAIKASDNPDSYTNGLAKARDGIETAWREAEVKNVDKGVYWEQLWEYDMLTNRLVSAVVGRHRELDGEYGRHADAYTRLSGAKIADASRYHKVLNEIAGALNALPKYGAASPWKAKYDALRENYRELQTTLSASTAKIEVINAGDEKKGNVSISVTLGGKTETIAPGKSCTFDKLDVWKSYDISAVVASGRDAPTATAPSGVVLEDYALDHAAQSASAQGPGSSVPVSFMAVYKGDAKLVVKNVNAIPVKVNGKEIVVGESCEFTGRPRANFTLNYVCEDDAYMFEEGAGESIAVMLGNAGSTLNVVAAKLVKKSTIVEEKKRAVKDIFKKHKEALQEGVLDDGFVAKYDFDPVYAAVCALSLDMDTIIGKGHQHDDDVRDIYELFMKALRALRNDKTRKQLEGYGVPEKLNRLRRFNDEVGEKELKKHPEFKTFPSIKMFPNIQKLLEVPG